MPAAVIYPRHIRPAQGTGGYAVRPLQKARREAAKLSQKTRKTFEAISDPANAHLFTTQAALKAFRHIKA